MDKRKSNGGHSTKSKGVDKRKNVYKDALDALTVDKLRGVLTMLHKKATEDNDTAAGKILLEWYLSKPTASTDLTTNGKDINISPIEWVE